MTSARVVSKTVTVWPSSFDTYALPAHASAATKLTAKTNPAPIHSFMI
jgi:hypothetical protein